MRLKATIIILFLIGGIACDLLIISRNSFAISNSNPVPVPVERSTRFKAGSRTAPAASKPVPRVRPASRGEKQALLVGITAYTWTGYPTASGRWPRVGRTIAVNPEKIPLGSVVYIEGVGARVAEDIIPELSIKKGADIDIYFGRGEKAVQDALKFGRKKKWKAWIVELPKGSESDAVR